MSRAAINLVDCSFTGKGSFGFGQENAYREPEKIQWKRVDRDALHSFCVYTEMDLMRYNPDPKAVNIGILIEPHGWRPNTYEMALKVKDHFRAIFTHYRPFYEMGPPFQYYPLGGSLIMDWDVFHKSGLVSMIEGTKQKADGHKLRHHVYDLFRNKVSVYGHNETFSPKYIALRRYRYSIVIENCREDSYFSEKLIDCFSQGTIPIYWGCPSIGDFFDQRGFYTFTTDDELAHIIDTVDDKDYASKLEYVRDNFATAKRYRCPEDRLYESYREIFDDGRPI